MTMSDRAGPTGESSFGFRCVWRRPWEFFPGGLYIISLIIGIISSLSYSVSIFLRDYNSPENIEERCTVKFQQDTQKGVGKSDKEWGLNMDMANDNYFKCMNIP